MCFQKKALYLQKTNYKIKTMEHILTLGITLFTAILLVVCGTSVVKRPSILSNYNSFTEKEKASPAFKTYLKRVRNIMIGTAVIIVAGQFLSMLTDSEIFFIISILLMCIGLPASLFYCQAKVSKRMHRKSLIYAGFFLVISSVVLGGLLIPSLQGGNVSYENNTLRISGIYGAELKKYEIKSITKVDAIPQVNLRTNGFGLGDIRKGFFRTVDGKIVHFILTSNNLPVLHISTTKGENIYVNTLDSKEMDELIQSFEKENN